MFKKSGINIEIVLKVLILLGFSVFLIQIMWNKDILLYVHPRIVPYAQFTVAAMILIAFFMLEDIFKHHEGKGKVTTYVIFITTLIMSFGIPAISMDSTSGRKVDISQNAAAAQQTNAADFKAAESGFELRLKDDTVVFEDSNHMAWLRELYDNKEKYYGKNIDITGFVLKEKGFKENELVVARFIMTCCTADVQAVGIMCNYARAAEFEQDTWVKVKGKIKTVEFMGQSIPAIDVSEIKKVEKPENEYIYSY